MLARRLLLFAAVLMLLTTLASAIAPRQPLPAPGAVAPDPALPAGGVLERRISADPGSDASVTMRRGELLRLEVEGDVLDAVAIERLDRVEGIEPLTPARFEVLAEEPGVYPIRLVEAGRRIGRIEIRP